MSFKICMTVPSSIVARCNLSRKTLLAVAAVSVAGAVVVAATRARGRKSGKTSEGTHVLYVNSSSLKQ